MFVLANGFCDLTLTLCRDFYKIKRNELETDGSIFVLLVNARYKRVCNPLTDLLNS